MVSKRLKDTTPEEFKRLLADKKIRPASLQDVEGLHHQRPLYQHPNTKQYWTDVRD